MSSPSDPAGPSRPSRAAPPHASASPLPQPIRRAVRSARPTPQVAAQQQSATPNPRAKSLFGSFKALSPNTRILLGLVGIAIGGAGLLADRFVLPQQGEEKPFVTVRAVDRE